jgi:hypothetical protein
MVLDPKTDSVLREGDEGRRVTFDKLWRGHKVGAVARLTTEVADKLQSQGIVSDVRDQEQQAAAQPQRSTARKKLNVDTHSND